MHLEPIAKRERREKKEDDGPTPAPSESSLRGIENRTEHSETDRYVEQIVAHPVLFVLLCLARAWRLVASEHRGFPEPKVYSVPSATLKVRRGHGIFRA